MRFVVLDLAKLSAMEIRGAHERGGYLGMASAGLLTTTTTSHLSQGLIRRSYAFPIRCYTTFLHCVYGSRVSHLRSETGLDSTVGTLVHNAFVINKEKL